jgi:TatA/E family protein of Tat protein translocase
MGPLGWQETVFIFVLALLIFGPKKLPELGKTIGKAMSEFRRATSDLKSQFDREMQSIERESESLKEVTYQYQNDIRSSTSDYNYSYNYDSYDYGSEGQYGGTEPNPSTASTTAAPVSASATQGAEQNGTATAQNGTAPDIPDHPSSAEPPKPAHEPGKPA